MNLAASTRRVGPVLSAGALARAVVAAIREQNPAVQVLDRGAYYRVLVEGVCRVRRDSIEKFTGRSFALPSDLEAIMPSFQGFLNIDSDYVEWSAEPA
jgi:MmoB/DmpM family protein